MQRYLLPVTGPVSGGGTGTSPNTVNLTESILTSDPSSGFLSNFGLRSNTTARTEYTVTKTITNNTGFAWTSFRVAVGCDPSRAMHFPVLLSLVSVKGQTIPSGWTTTCCLKFPDWEFRFHWTQCCQWLNHYSYLQCGRWYWLVRSSAYGTVCQRLRRSRARHLRNAWAWFACPGRFPKALQLALKTVTQVNATSYGGLRLF